MIHDAARRATTGEVTGMPDPWIIHYAYDAFGRLIATQRPWPAAPAEVRTTRHYYEGTRRIQDVNIDPIIGVLPPTQSSIPLEGSSGQADPMINAYVARDYIYTPGYVDKLQCMIDSTGAGSGSPTINRLIGETCVVAFEMAMLVVLFDRQPQISLADGNEPGSARLLDRPDEPFGMGVEVGTTRRKPHWLDTGGPEQG